jgi:hypothetical protein
VKLRVEECLQACAEGIRSLDKKLRKFDHPDTVKRIFSRTLYPFKASTLAKLREIVGELLAQLNLALQALELEQGRTRHEASESAIERAPREIKMVADEVEIIKDAILRTEQSNADVVMVLDEIKVRHNFPWAIFLATSAESLC